MAVGDVNATTKGSGARYNDGKPDLSLIPLHIITRYLTGIDSEPLSQAHLRVPLAMGCVADWQRSGNIECLYNALHELDQALHQAARVLTYGTQKYAAWNWAKGMAWSIPVACMARHAYSVMTGEQNDPESGWSHEGHIACNIIMLIHFASYYPEGDDITFSRILPAP